MKPNLKKYLKSIKTSAFIIKKQLAAYLNELLKGILLRAHREQFGNNDQKSGTPNLVNIIKLK